MTTWASAASSRPSAAREVIVRLQRVVRLDGRRSILPVGQVLGFIGGLGPLGVTEFANPTKDLLWISSFPLVGPGSMTCDIHQKQSPRPRVLPRRAQRELLSLA
jgi:hypothetical protein